MKGIISKLICCFMILSSTQLWAASRYIYGEGRFWAEKSDKQSFIQEQLLYNAFSNIISKELKKMGLDAEKFWSAYDIKFEESFESVKESLIAKYKMNENPSAAQKNAYKERLRYLKLFNRRKFKKLQLITPSFAIKKMSRSQNNPQSRFISVEAKVDRVALNKLYYSLIREKTVKKFDKLFVKFEYQLRNAQWSDLGVSGETILTDEVNNYWLKWLGDKKPENINEIVLVDDAKQEIIQNHLKLSHEDVALHINPLVKDGLYLVNRIIIGKVRNPASNNLELVYEGGLMLMDLSTNTVIYQSDLSKRTKIYEDIEGQELSSAIANYIYRLPLGEFSQNYQVAQNSDISNKVKSINLEGYKNLGEVLKFKKLLVDFGSALQLKAELNQFEREKSELIVFYKGDDTILVGFLEDLKAKASARSLNFEFIDPAKPYQIQFVYSKEAKNPTEVEL